MAKGLEAAEQVGQRLAEAELHRLKGELLLIKDVGNVAEAPAPPGTSVLWA